MRYSLFAIAMAGVVGFNACVTPAALIEKGDYAQAERMIKKSLEKTEKSHGPDHPALVPWLTNLARVYDALGDDAKAEPLYIRALAIREKSLGPDHQDTALSLNNLAIYYGHMGEYTKAESLYERAIAIWEKTLGSKHPFYVMALNNLALLYVKMGYTDKAVQLLNRALAISKEVLRPKHPLIGMTLYNLAGIYIKMGEYAKAESMSKRGLIILEEKYGPENRNTLHIVTQLAFVQDVINKDNEALALYIRLFNARNKFFENVIFSITNEQQKLRFIEQSSDYHALLSFVHRKFPEDQKALKAALDVVLFRKGIVFNAQARQNETLAQSLDPKVRKLWDELSFRYAELSKLLQDGTGKLKPAEYNRRVNAINGEIEKLESSLASKSALVAGELEKRKVTTEELATRLPKDTVLAEFVMIRDFEWSKLTWTGRQRYLVFILHLDKRVEMVDLGSAENLDIQVRALLSLLTAPPTNKIQIKGQMDAAKELYQLIWEPVAKMVGFATHVIVSPDGVLNLVPFAALAGADGKYLAEKIVFSYVTSGRDLVGGKGIMPEMNLFLAANPAFDKDMKSGERTDTRGAFRSRDFNMRFDPLPGTEVESREVPKQFQGENNRIVTGTDATEREVLSTRRPRILHLATHGFFLPDLPELKMDETRMGFDVKPVLPKGYENPLVRSGLAFAGANNAAKAQGSDDGLLTALEVSGMDLHGTDLVTLSACETGVGEVKTGEGVYGLRRAFALAGARNLMMSLWPVSDEITAEQMMTFYKLYGHGTPAAEALRSAQLETISKLRAKYGSAPPSLWAPFIMQGAPE